MSKYDQQDFELENSKSNNDLQNDDLENNKKPNFLRGPTYDQEPEDKKNPEFNRRKTAAPHVDDGSDDNKTPTPFYKSKRVLFRGAVGLGIGLGLSAIGVGVTAGLGLLNGAIAIGSAVGGAVALTCSCAAAGLRYGVLYKRSHDKNSDDAHFGEGDDFKEKDDLFKTQQSTVKSTTNLINRAPLSSPSAVRIHTKEQGQDTILRL